MYKKANSLESLNDSFIREALSGPENKHFISKFYSEMCIVNLEKLAWLEISLHTMFKCVINDNMWDNILLLPSRISICSRYEELQYNMPHYVYITIYLMKSKYKAGVSPNCPKCKT